MRAIVVADSGAVHAALTQRLAGTPRIELVRHASGRANVEQQMRGYAPDVVLLHDMELPLRAIARVQEIRNALPGAAIVVLAERLQGAWIGEALRLGATVLPADVEQRAFERVLEEILASPASTVIDFPRSGPGRPPLSTLETHPEGSAA
jgi:DNA-binding NarL/FixJ family response regulator